MVERGPRKDQPLCDVRENVGAVLSGHHTKLDLRSRGFAGLTLGDDAGDHGDLSEARENVLLETGAKWCFERPVQCVREQGFGSDERFGVDGTALGAHAAQKRLKHKDSTMMPLNRRRRWAQREARLQRRKAPPRDARVEDRPGGAPCERRPGHQARAPARRAVGAP